MNLVLAVEFYGLKDLMVLFIFVLGTRVITAHDIAGSSPHEASDVRKARFTWRVMKGECLDDENFFLPCVSP